MQNTESKLKIKEKNDLASIIIMAIILFTNLVIENAKYIKYVYIIAVISLVYIVYLIIKKPKTIIYLLSSYSFYWIMGFSIIMFIYGYFGENKSEYSLQFHILNIYWIIVVLLILNSDSDKIIDKIAKSNAIVIIAMTIFVFINNSFSLSAILNYNGKLTTSTAVGNKNTTAMSYIVLIMPLVYKVLIDKNKKYTLILLIGMAIMLLTGSKKSIFSIMIMIIVVGIGRSTNIKKLFKNIFFIAIVIAMILTICYYIPILHSIIWERLQQMLESLSKFSYSGESSTELRMKFIITAFTKGWDKPITGHGWGAFALMYGYSPLYRANLYTHNNYAEIFFSFGLFGMIIYYWFPIRIIVKTLKNKDRNKKTFCAMYIIVLLFLDFGTVSCYSSILQYISFAVAGFVLREDKNEEMQKIDKKI